MRNEDQCFEELEQKLKPKTTGAPQPVTIECKRKWFRVEYDYLADDETVELDWMKKEADKLNEPQLRQTISNNFNNKKLVEYCESRLSGLNVNTALVEQSEVKVGEVG